MIWYPAEIKASISWKMFQKMFRKLIMKTDESYICDMIQRVIYYADTPHMELFKSKHVVLRYRRSNQTLETVIKLRDVSPAHAEQLKKERSNIPQHLLKIERDYMGTKKRKLSVSIKYLHPAVPPGLSFFFVPGDFLSAPQEELLKSLVPIKISDLRFMIPIQSKCFVFDTNYQEFETVVLEERKLPTIFGKKLYEISLKTQIYTEKTVEHFMSYLEDLHISVSDEPTYKTERFYEKFFGT